MDAFDLKFSRVTGIDHIRPLAKFQLAHVTSWYFTDRSVNYIISAIMRDLVTLKLSPDVHINKRNKCAKF